MGRLNARNSRLVIHTAHGYCDGSGERHSYTQDADQAHVYKGVSVETVERWAAMHEGGRVVRLPIRKGQRGRPRGR